MFFLILTIASHTLVMFAMRFTESNRGNRYAATVFTYITCAILAFILMEDKTMYYPGSEYLFMLGISAFNGICMTAGMLLCRLSMGVNGTPISTTFNRLGVLIPTLSSILFFHEIPKPVQVVGIALAVTAIVYINSGKEERKNNHIKSVKLLILIFVVGGMIDLNTKIYELYGNAAMKGQYIFFTFVFCIIVSLIVMMAKDRKFSKQDMLVGAATGLPNTFILYFSLRAVSVLPAYIVFPAYSAGVILLVNIFNYFVFRESLSKQEKAATGLVAVALILINI